MSQAIRTGRVTFSDHIESTLRRSVLWAVIGVALYFLLALASYTPSDPGWSHVGTTVSVANLGGRGGAWLADMLFFLFGMCAPLLPSMLIWNAALLLGHRSPAAKTSLFWMLLRWAGFAIGLFALTALASRHLAHVTVADIAFPNGSGGGLGLVSAQVATRLLSHVGTDLALAGIMLVALALFTCRSPVALIQGIGALTLWLVRTVLFLPPPTTAYISTAPVAPVRRRPSTVSVPLTPARPAVAPAAPAPAPAAVKAVAATPRRAVASKSPPPAVAAVKTPVSQPEVTPPPAAPPAPVTTGNAPARVSPRSRVRREPLLPTALAVLEQTLAEEEDAMDRIVIDARTAFAR